MHISQLGSSHHTIIPLAGGSGDGAVKAEKGQLCSSSSAKDKVSEDAVEAMSCDKREANSNVDCAGALGRC